MFQVIQRLISDAGLKGCNFNVQASSGTKISVILSFALKDEAPSRLFDESTNAAVNANADSIIALRSALSVPLVVTGEASEIESALRAALTQLSAGVVDAAQTYRATDINAMLNAASQSVKSKKEAAAKTTGKSAKPAATATQSAASDDMGGDDDEHGEDDAAPVADDKVTKPATVVTPDVSSFDAFDSL